jgi:hypothetical protein
VHSEGISEITQTDGGINQEGYESTKQMRVHLVAAGVVLAFAAVAAAHEPLTLAVSPLQSFAPTHLTIRVHVEPNPDNRILEVVTESVGYYRSSRVQLDGDDAPRTTSLEVRNLPGGNYEVRGALIDQAGHERAVVRTRVVVLGSADSGDGR